MRRMRRGCWADERNERVIETARLVLRSWREDDKLAFAAAFNTPGVMRWLGGVQPQAEMDAQVDKRLADQAREGCSYWAVERLADGVLVASCGVRRGLNYRGTPVEGMYEMGWRVAEAHWGQGYAREAAEGTLRWLWAITDATVVAAWTTTENRPSWSLMERLGMTRRPDLDFRRVGVALDDPQGALIVYTLDRP